MPTQSKERALGPSLPHTTSHPQCLSSQKQGRVWASFVWTSTCQQTNRR